MLTQKQIIELQVTIDKVVYAFGGMARAMGDLFASYGGVVGGCMAAQPEYIRNSSLKQIGGHYFGLWWYSDVSEVTVLPVHPIIRQYPVSCFVAKPLEVIGASVEPRPPPGSAIIVLQGTARLSPTAAGFFHGMFAVDTWELQRSCLPSSWAADHCLILWQSLPSNYQGFYVRILGPRSESTSQCQHG